MKSIIIGILVTITLFNLQSNIYSQNSTATTSNIAMIVKLTEYDFQNILLLDEYK